MYLTQEIFIGGDYEHREVEGTIDITIAKRAITIPLNKVSEIILSIGYWRKANAIHNWFVKNVQDGRDECQKEYVSKEELLNLRATCQKVINSLESGNVSVDEYGYTIYHSTDLAEELLPPSEGFFFGGTSVDIHYMQDLKDTIEIIDGIDFDAGSIYYQSSW